MEKFIPSDEQFVDLPSKEQHYYSNTSRSCFKSCLKYVGLVFLTLCLSAGISTVISYKFYEKGDAHYRRKIAETMRADDWSKWSSWGECSVTCGTGTIVRTRKCTGNNCGEYSIDKDICSNHHCKDNWTSWSPWGECSVTCGTGTKVRTRKCTGNYCGEFSIDKDICSRSLCKDSWNEWSEWSGCSAPCGSGMRTRTRTCNGTRCGDLYKENGLCNQPACVGEWSDWGAWGQCSVTCGTGMTVRHRTCNSVHPCGDSFTSQTVCDKPLCKDRYRRSAASSFNIDLITMTSFVLAMFCVYRTCLFV